MLVHRGLKALKTSDVSASDVPKLGLVARQLDDFHHQADDRDDKRRGTENQCYYSSNIYVYHLLTARQVGGRKVAIVGKPH